MDSNCDTRVSVWCFSVGEHLCGDPVGGVAFILFELVLCIICMFVMGYVHWDSLQ